MSFDCWEALIKKYADGRPICNCGHAYYSPCGTGMENGQKSTNMLACKYGCSVNQYVTKEYIAKRVVEDLQSPTEKVE